MTVRMYAERQGWPLKSVRVMLRHSRIHAKDCAACATKTGRIDHIEREVWLMGELTGDQRERLMEIADKCPVRRTLQSRVTVATSQAQQDPCSR